MGLVSKPIQRMNPIFLGTVLFGLMFDHAAASLCVPTEYTIHVEKKECTFCLAINTTICAGFCLTRDPNLKERLLKSTLSQTVCTYKDYVYQTVAIPGCPVHINPHYTYPVAVSCMCSKCNTDYSDCVHEISTMNHCTKPQKTNLLELSNYIQ
ncbi:thyrotropin subunit beta [Microcaecilia unicolor]|uniref:Thyrotropin subunit beta n=1 Tax=Microcaecilia unicolor TaxID=1415580 RepID=A0A6P7ZPR2_9AMPH|nr:thyrotropin subunit beta [Microcaecilia unicolor]XP_030076255.1 thyrotropin subunit beta [Microcaecilia unicolor]XP_030076258.1 thyrotropin subunit beta [Microcaecilia unicolor]XP_030076259.1 thyrotropin subunit beta [Microcaecilia unicolor]